MDFKHGLLVLCILPWAVNAWNPKCISKPVGFGRLTTGGAGGKTVKPKDVKELRDLLKSPQKLIIDLDKVYDYTNTEGTAETTGCFFQKCGAGFQESLAKQGTCNGKPATKVKYSKAGLTELFISSHKTIMSSNGKGAIKGKGLHIQRAENVIIRDITISDINPQVIWAGDAMILDQVKNVWLHNLKFMRIGRQHIASFQNANTGVTISSCLFDGTSPYAAFCDGKHYWVWIFWGTRDEITMINNRIVNTAGRLPHTGGWAKSLNYIHVIGNEFDTNPHTAIEPKTGARLLVEGNKFIKFANCINPNAKGGHLAMINTPKAANDCKKYFGQACKVNTFTGGPVPKEWDETSVLQEYAKLDKEAINGARKAICL